MSQVPSDDRTPETSAAPNPAPNPALDALDQQLISLINQRAQLLQSEQDRVSAPVVRAAAEAARIDRLLVTAEPALAVPSARMADVLKHIASLCLQSLLQLRVAYLGPPHSYSHLAALKYFGDATTLVPVGSIPAVFTAVTRGECSTGIVPIENSTDGRVVDTLGMFVRNAGMQICGEVELPIHHCLLSCTSRNEIREVHSKPQALSQCRGWLASQLPQAKLIEVASTAAAAERAAKVAGVAAVASIQAGRQYGLDVVETNIEDNPHNVTRFAVLGKELPPPTGDDKTSLLFQLSHRPGALADAMNIFKDRELNLTWIESFPAPESKSEYLFFVELSGHRDEASVRAAVDALAAETQSLTVLGSYPRATAE